MTVCVSIIVPVYNKEDYIEKTIQSVINQSNPDWELLLIDDGSTDNSTAICEQYSANDKRVILLKKENGGVSSARNFGLDNACGEFVMFLDADDTLDSNAVQMMSENIKEADLVVCSMKCLDEGVDVPSTQTAILMASTLNSRQHVQRRGRVLRKSPGKEKANIYDLVVFPNIKNEPDYIKRIVKNEQKRYDEYADLADNYVECSRLFMKKWEENK